MPNLPYPITDGDAEDWKRTFRIRRLLMAVLGGLIAALGLDLFLVPSGIITGGVTGISALASHITGLHTGMFVFVLNLPLLLLAFRQSAREKALIAAIGLLTFSICSIVFYPVPSVIDSKIGSAAIGGILLGTGIGIGIRYGIILDTLQMPKLSRSLTRLLNRIKLPGVQIGLNLALLTVAGLVLGWELAMYSAIACLAALEAIRISTSSFSFHLGIRINSANEDALAQAINTFLNREPEEADMEERSKFTADGNQAQSEAVSGMLYRIHLFELPRFKSIVRNLDPEAVVTYDAAS
ncbi:MULTISPECIES: YitT family protein [Paenibacillus]|uniref:Membrane protein n=1 Tax=Paenibacillus campinasensis TaxID=66347 RepID=A0A268F4B7_9BACL|nr:MULTISPECIES: YitT family protein [Paenibacillus]PAD80226.1 membrane protein [Paenibacillus campinasensis]PAK55209.1 membrane protein [Paenibacillus sp. 7541]